MEYKIASGLDFKEYGGIAYTLNYPNPVDKLRGKTGHGIWIHSKGLGIEPPFHARLRRHRPQGN